MLEQFRAANGLSAEERAAAFWTCKIGPLTLRLPNWSWRRKAILAHDLHHVLTGYPCSMRGEFRMAAWEFGAGRMPHWGASLFCAPLVLIGFFWSPRRMVRAFRSGMRSRSLHEEIVTDPLLDTPFAVARARLVPDRTRRFEKTGG